MPLDTTVRHYTSSMNGAPILTNAANSFIALLDAVLVNGFGNVTLTSLSVSNNIATATVSTGYNVGAYSVVTIAGATPSGLNGEKKVTSSNSTTFTFEANGVNNGAATGTITCRFPGAGWTKPYANTVANVAVYRNSTGTGAYYRVTDSGTTDIRIIGYGSMKNADEGTELFPSPSQLSGGIYCPKSQPGVATAKNWWIVADSKMVYLGIAHRVSDYPNTYCTPTCFGDIKSYKPNDLYSAILTGLDFTAGNNQDLNGYHNAYTNTYNNGSKNRYIRRAYHGQAGSKIFNNDYYKEGYNTWGVIGGTNGFIFPNPPSNSIILFPLSVTESGTFTVLRGEYYGLYATVNDVNSTSRYFDNDTIFLDTPFVGNVSLYKAIALDTSGPGCVFINISGPWE